MVPYDVLLSYPNQSQPNYISIIDTVGSEVLHMHTDQTHEQAQGQKEACTLIPILVILVRLVKIW